MPYWRDEKEGAGARWRLAGVFGMALLTTGATVAFNFIGRDFFSAIANKDPEEFRRLLLLYVATIACAIPLFIYREFLQQRLVLRWRRWMTKTHLQRYFNDRCFYKIQAGGLVDNPDQRINDDINAFTESALGLLLVLFNSTIDLVSFSGILLSISPTLCGVLVGYAVGGTALTYIIGRPLVALNFSQETLEADFRYSLVRVRENAESIAFYRGEANERRLLMDRFERAFDNLSRIIITQRNLEAFTSSYRFLIQFLPAAVVAPLYFAGNIEFGVITQSNSAFNHILGDVSLVVYQFERLASFSAVIERLGQFGHVLDANAEEAAQLAAASVSAANGGAATNGPAPKFVLREKASASAAVDGSSSSHALLTTKDLTLTVPSSNGSGADEPLVRGLNFELKSGEPLLIMGASGAGKTTLLRALAGLWERGSGRVALGVPEEEEDLFFVPQRPYLVLGSLRQQLLYPTWTTCDDEEESCRIPPSDEALEEALHRVNLGHLLNAGGLDAAVDWPARLSLGEQQRIAFARLVLAAPRLALLDESTSALDVPSEAAMYRLLSEGGITYASVGHRPTLIPFHSRVLRLSGGSGKASDGTDAGSWELLSSKAVSDELTPVR